MSGWKIFGIILACFVGIWLLGYALGWFGEAARVAQDEFGAQAALEKYEWFIDQAKAITKMDQDIAIFENRVSAVDSQYASYGKDRSKWSISIQAQYNQAKQQARDDLTAVVSQRNGLVRGYNAASEKFNWKPFQSKPDKPRETFFDYVATTR